MPEAALRGLPPAGWPQPVATLRHRLGQGDHPDHQPVTPVRVVSPVTGPTCIRKQMVLDTVGRPAKTTVKSQLSTTVSEKYC